MAEGFPPLVFVYLYQSRSRKLLGRPQTWRWRALSGNNFRTMAASSESYTNRQDCLDAITQLFGADTNVYLRQHEQGNQPLRMASPPQ